MGVLPIVLGVECLPAGFHCLDGFKKLWLSRRKRHFWESSAPVDTWLQSPS